MVLDILFVLLVVLSTLLMVTTLGYALYLGVLTRSTRTGRTIFGIIGSLKGFVLLILLDFYIAVWHPEWVQQKRQLIRFGLVVYLVVQSMGSLVSLERLRRYGES